MSQPSLYRTQASEITKPFDFTTHPDWPINPLLNYNLKKPMEVDIAQRPKTPKPNSTITP
jgi:hypothetical protein